ncbi:MAG: hypothetical protein H2045_12730 [Rhizobiales bacterium]|nr:hypothetical protein [Hyphomicrobiales bacterium]
MALLRIILFFVSVLFVGAFFTDDASAHGGHGHDQVVTGQVVTGQAVTGQAVTGIDMTASSVGQQNQIHDQAAKTQSDQRPHGDGVNCESGCCSVACAACCVTLSSVFAIDHPGYRQSDNQAWRHYVSPLEALNLPNTPPPRV